MQIDSLSWEGFRNLESGRLQPVPGVNILYGDNAQGKTNLLEAIWLFTGGRSFRGARDSELVRIGGEKARLSLEFTAADRRQEAEITVEKRRAAVLNGVPQASAAQLAGVFCAVVFSPAHLALVKDGPEGRRRFLDAAYCQLRPGYVHTLAEYNRALTQRNALLKDARFRPDCMELLEIFDEKLAQLGARVILARNAYIARLQPIACSVYDGLSGGREQLEIAYRFAADGMTADRETLVLQLREMLKARRKEELAAGCTLTGPHRDDLEVTIGGLPARSFGSQGQQRSAVLALKLAEASVLREVTGEQPVALLDDVMSELDVSRQDYILNHIHGWQVFITCCEPSAVLRLAGGRTFHIQSGAVAAENDHDGSSFAE